MKRGTLLLALLATACAGPRPMTPGAASVTPPAGWRTGGTVDAVIATDWWRAFGDPVLARLIEEALANNPDIATAAARVEEARAGVLAARGAQLPAVSVGGGPAEQRALNAFGTPIDQTVGQVQATVSYDFDLFGRLRNQTAAARATLLSAQAGRDTVRLAIATSVASGYMTLRSLDERLGVLRDTLAARAESRRIAQRRFDVGYSSRFELAQAEADYRATEQLIPAALLAITRTEDALSVLTGTSPRAIERGVALDRLTLPPITAPVPASVLRRRPDIAQAEAQIVAADRSLDSARAAFMPNIALTGSAGFVVSSLLANPVSLFSIGASALQPIFQGGRLRAQADAAAARRDQAAFAYRKTALAAFRDVDDALAGVRRYDEQERALAAQRDAAALALKLATERYRSGYSAYLEQVDAQRGLLATQLALVQARADRLTAAVTLYQALGGGWGAP